MTGGEEVAMEIMFGFKYLCSTVLSAKITPSDLACAPGFFNPTAVMVSTSGRKTTVHTLVAVSAPFVVMQARKGGNN